MTRLRRITTIAAASALLALGGIAPAQAQPLVRDGHHHHSYENHHHHHAHSHCLPIIGCPLSL
ncbi:hypothetical protein GCM10010211_76530 [Streptomyces albospinus]|uniref:Uncharacterized protein n=1 Tax=Streptomyces albospinus TaxID=285515 RepID=A0ABQ2VNT5_9ACTN|nr:hypothetical protein [Streptomyces albospinus]GGU97915.1 hypothetical protein GCM10010211_76530 [Streptomyces albospinus]